MKKFRVFDFKKRKVSGHCFSTITAYDAITATLIERAQIPMILVGDSVGTTLLGYSSTIYVTLDDILHHCAAVRRGAPNTFIVADMPFGTYHRSIGQALKNAQKLLQKGGADAVKIEGGADMASTVSALVQSGIPVVGHIGLLPQHVMTLGGYFKRGKTPKDVEILKNDAHEIEKAGAFMMVIECVLEDVASDITEKISIPTIGIGSGEGCDAQIQVVNDLIAFSSGKLPTHAMPLATVSDAMTHAFELYKQQVEG